MGFQFFETFTTAVLFVITSLFLLYCWFQYKFTYWAKKGVSGPKPVFPFGNMRDVMKGKAQFFEPYVQSYWQYKDLPYVGMYFFQEPALCINDPDLAKVILVKDFDNFQSHGFMEGGTGNPMTDHIFNLHGTAWKKLRNKMSPTFGTKTLKHMYSLIDEIADEAADYAEMLRSTEGSIDFSEFYSKYTMEIISSVGFGIKSQKFKKENTEFHDRGCEFMAPKHWYRSAIRYLAIIAPTLFDTLRVPRYDSELQNFYVNILTETVNYRKKHKYTRNDFLQALIDLSEQPKQDNVDSTDDEFTINNIIANSMLYMVAGFDTSSIVGQCAAFHLATHPDIQNRAREEVQAVLAKYDGKCTYEAQNEMVYLNMVFDETMRLFPPMRALFRKCTKDFILPNTDIVIEEGTRIFIPVHSIHKDPNIFPDPEKFDPERFTAERKAKLHPCHWMPFGEGPRKCLGLRQGYIQTKIVLVKILQKYEILLDEKTQVPLQLRCPGLSLGIKNGIWLKLKPLSS